MPRASMVAAMSAALYLDTVTVEVVDALQAQGIPSLLLKGPAMQAAFYEPHEFRPYGDVDLLVPVDQLERAGDALAALGFVERLSRSDNIDPRLAGSAWDREQPLPATVDLHKSFHGVLDPDGLWRALTDDSRTIAVGGGHVDSPSRTGAALVAVLHASTAQAGHPRPIDDLRRAVATLTADEWQDVGRRLRQAGALRLAHATLHDLGHGDVATLIDAGSVSKAELLAVRGVDGSERLLAFLGETSWRARLRLVKRTLWPSATFIRWLAAEEGRAPRAVPVERTLRWLSLIRRTAALAIAARTIRG